eukprot:COSAG05_NODE_6659_length_925_cov_0.630751_1_plen_307_part_11
MLLISEFSHSIFAVPYFLLLALYSRAWLLTETPDNQLLRQLHSLMAYYAVLEFFACFATHIEPINVHFQGLEDSLDSTSWLNMSGVNYGPADTEHHTPYEWGTRAALVLSHTWRCIVEERWSTSDSSQSASDLFKLLCEFAPALGQSDCVEAAKLEAVLRWLNLQYFAETNQNLHFMQYLEQMLAMAIDSDKIGTRYCNQQGFDTMLRFMESSDSDFLFDTIDHEQNDVLNFLKDLDLDLDQKVGSVHSFLISEGAVRMPHENLDSDIISDMQRDDLVEQLEGRLQSLIVGQQAASTKLASVDDHTQ